MLFIGLFIGLIACDSYDPKDGIINDSILNAADMDGDGFTDLNDCDDSDAEINMDAIEICDGLDNNCSGTIDENVTNTYYPDGDGDGYGVASSEIEACEAPDGYSPNNNDCDDSNASVYPNAEELCDGLDTNCDGVGDTLQEFYLDIDGDGFGDVNAPSENCELDDNVVDNSEDCNDTEFDVNPDAEEVCDEIDNNCDGNIDEGVLNIYYLDSDNDGYGSGQFIESCEEPEGYVSNNTDCNDQAQLINPMALEICDQQDNDCNSSIDDGLNFQDYYLDSDEDGFGDPLTSVNDCTPPSGFVLDNTDCDDSSSTVNPGMSELCDGSDNNCNSQIDEGLTFFDYFSDSDGDGYGNPIVSTNACAQPLNMVLDNTDCNDGNPNVNPLEDEVCNTIDDDCDGHIDNNAVDAIDFFPDGDGDGFGVGTPITQCNQPLGYSDNPDDCNDGNASINPTATEICNNIDDNCSGQADDGLTFIDYYLDSDNDGFGTPLNTVNACAQPSGMVIDMTDCNDNDANINPSELESCNSFDDDCNGQIDDGLTFIDYYADTDGDGYGDPTSSTLACSQPNNTVTNFEDCDDGNAAINPSEQELCNSVDDDCDGFVDEISSNSLSWYYDFDGDGYGNGIALLSCSQPSGYVSLSGDCDDFDSDISPNGNESCDGKDNDCDGQIDSNAVCPCNVENNDGHAYLFCDSPSNWWNARTGCENIPNYQLVVINDSSEQSWVWSTSLTYSSDDWWWIGYFNYNSDWWEEPDGGWEWVDGSSNTYSNWYPNEQPDNYYGNEDCAHIYADTGYWNDMNCSNDDWYGTDIFFICESNLP